MKFPLTIFGIVLTLQLYTQTKLTQKFTGQITYDIQNFNGFIRCDSCGNYNDIRVLSKKDDFFQITDSFKLDKSLTSYLPVKISKRGANLQLTYFNPKTKSNDSIDEFPLNKGDTILSTDYLILFDKRDSLISIVMSETVNIGDTTINALGYLYNCYRFEKFNYWRKTNPGPSHEKQIIYIDKLSLLPIQEEWLHWFKRHPCLPKQKWTLSTRIVLLSIKNGM